MRFLSINNFAKPVVFFFPLASSLFSVYFPGPETGCRQENAVIIHIQMFGPTESTKSLVVHTYSVSVLSIFPQVSLDYIKKSDEHYLFSCDMT